MASLPAHHISAASIGSALTGLSGLLTMTQRLVAALSAIASPVPPPPAPTPGAPQTASALDQIAHYQAQAEAKADHAAQVLAEVQDAAAAVSRAAAAGAALVRPQGPA